MKPTNPTAMATDAVRAARQTAIAAAKKVAQDQLKAIEKAKNEVVGLPSAEEAPAQPPPAMADIATETGETFQQMEQRLNAESTQLLANINAEILQLRNKREQEEQQRVAQQQQEAVQEIQVAQEQEQKRESAMSRAIKGIKSRIAGKREQGKQHAG